MSSNPVGKSLADLQVKLLLTAKAVAQADDKDVILTHLCEALDQLAALHAVVVDEAA